MDIQNDIKKYLENRRCSASYLAKQAGVAPPIITRILSGERKGVHSKTLERLWPFLYEDNTPEKH
jgi:DNA-binding Xre family transcriptional regulator